MLGMVTVRVAVGVVIDDSGRVLIALRPDSAHQGGLWEFPGGKCESGESVEDALRRELLEETGIRVLAQQPLCVIQHDYGDKRVLLDVRRVTCFEGDARGCEGQQVQWADVASLDPVSFPAANRSIVRRLQLPTTLAITGHATSEDDFRSHFLTMLDAAPGMIQLRDPDIATSALIDRARWCLPRCRERAILLLVNGDPSSITRHIADGVHLNSRRLLAQDASWVASANRAGMLVSASCHDARQLAQAQAIGVDFALLSPVLPTASHPDAKGLGWAQFQQLLQEISLPIYALGGVSPADLDLAREHGANGVAAMSAYWGSALIGA